MLAGFYLGEWTMLGLTLLISILATREYHNIAVSCGVQCATIHGQSAAAITVVLFFFAARGTLPQTALAVCAIIPFTILLQAFSAQHNATARAAYGTMAYFHVALPTALLPFLAFGNNGTYDWRLPIYILLLIWINDTFAYFSGRAIGKHKLFERISPKKTWEGLAGGAITSLLFAYFISEPFVGITVSHGCVISIITTITGVLGDLVESALKRTAGLKDSGSILPGHGGVLDRFDSFLFTLPFVFAYLFTFVL